MKKMRISCINTLVIIGTFLIFISSCKKEEKAQLSILLTSALTDIVTTTATCGGNITSDGGSTIFSRGVCWSTNSNPTIVDNKTSNGTGTGIFTSAITGLTPGATYYFRAYATNSIGTAYGNEVTITTTAALPTLTTTALSTITSISAISGGNITSDGGAAVTARGICWGTTQNPTIANSKSSEGTGSGIFSSNLITLTANTVYYVRAYAANSIGTAYGNQLSVTTLANLPTITTMVVTSITETAAICGGNIANDGGAAITGRGICWSINQIPTIEDRKTKNDIGTGSFTSSINELSSGTTYYLRAYAINALGIAYGGEVSFKTSGNYIGPVFNSNLTYGTLRDIDGNVYKTIKIGTQEWMAENLKTIHYRNGDPIPNVTDGSEWSDLTKGAYCDNKNNINNSATYGRIYNWFAVTDSRNIAPIGWHVADNYEWTTLVTYLGGTSVAGGKLKEKGTNHWVIDDNNDGASNETGFTAIPGGGRNFDGGFYAPGNATCCWWTSTEGNINSACCRFIFYDLVLRNSDGCYYGIRLKELGAPVRCIKD